MKVPFRRKNVYKGLLAGSLGGLAAAWVMSEFQGLMTRAMGQSHSPEQQSEEEDATVKTAKKISSGLLHHEISPERKKTAGTIVHYAYGAGIGALYGGLAQKVDTTTAGFGSAYGTAVWALGDEVAVPALKLGKKPTETPVPVHAQALAAHLVYGVALEGVRRLALKAL
jgi:putative membrane protein